MQKSMCSPEATISSYSSMLMPSSTWKTWALAGKTSSSKSGGKSLLTSVLRGYSSTKGFSQLESSNSTSFQSLGSLRVSTTSTQPRASFLSGTSQSWDSSTVTRVSGPDPTTSADPSAYSRARSNRMPPLPAPSFSQRRHSGGS